MWTVAATSRLMRPNPSPDHLPDSMFLHQRVVFFGWLIRSCGYGIIFRPTYQWHSFNVQRYRIFHKILPRTLSYIWQSLPEWDASSIQESNKSPLCQFHYSWTNRLTVTTSTIFSRIPALDITAESSHVPIPANMFPSSSASDTTWHTPSMLLCIYWFRTLTRRKWKRFQRMICGTKHRLLCFHLLPCVYAPDRNFRTAIVIRTIHEAEETSAHRVEMFVRGGRYTQSVQRSTAAYRTMWASPMVILRIYLFDHTLLACGKPRCNAFKNAKTQATERFTKL